MKFVLSLGLLVMVVLSVLGLSKYSYSKPQVFAYNTNSASSKNVASLSDFDNLPYLKYGFTIHDVTTYDRQGGNADNNAYNFYQNPQTGGYVVLEEHHPGVILRIHMPSGGSDVAPGNIRIYFDDETSPRVDMPFKDFFSGSKSPFLSPLVANADVSSRGNYSYYPFYFAKSVRVEFTQVPIYYMITYGLYNSSDGITTYTGHEDLSSLYNALNNPLQDPKTTAGNQTTSSNFSLNPGESKTLFESNSSGSIRSLVFKFPQFTTLADYDKNTVKLGDHGKDIYKGSSSFSVAIDPNNTGVILTRRMNFEQPNQMADIYVDNQLVGRWTNQGNDFWNTWRDFDFQIPQSFTQGKSKLNIKVVSANDSVAWNEYYYWIKSKKSDGTFVTTDTLDIGDTASEQAHNYNVVNQSWAGWRDLAYPAPQPDSYYQGIKATADVLSNTRIQIFWDNETSPSVDLPIGFLFGVGSGGEAKISGLLMGVDPTTHTFYNYFPMPYQSHAKVVIVNNSQTKISNASGNITYNQNTYEGLGDQAGYFNGIYNSQTTISGKDYSMVNIPSGKGQVVATILDISKSYRDDIMEGDHRAFIDTDLFNPVLIGTGTEDYFGGGYYFANGIFNLPTHGYPIKYNLDGIHHRVMYRFFQTDPISFESKLSYKFEHGYSDDVNADYKSAVFAYVVKNKENISQTDTLQVGNTADETKHNYSITNQTWSGNFSSDFIARDDGKIFSSTGRSHKGSSTFKVSISQSNSGVRIGRVFDYSSLNQKANVYVDNQLVGIWFMGGNNPYHKAFYDSFEIPQTYTSGKSQLQIKIEYLGGDLGWSELQYLIYSHTYNPTISSSPLPTSIPAPSLSPTPTPTSVSTPVPTPTSAPVCGTLNSGLVGFWKMDESVWTGTAGEVTDSSGNGNNGVASCFGSGCTKSSTIIGKYGSGGNFDGKDDYVNVGNGSSLNTPQGLTIAAWVKISDNTKGWNLIISKWNDTGSGTNKYAFHFAIHSGKVSFYVSPDGSNIGSESSSTTTLSNNTWYHVVGVVNPATHQQMVYVNGTQEGNTVNYAPLSIPTITQPVYFGSKVNTSGVEFQGVMDEVHIYSRALSSSEVVSLYDPTKCSSPTPTPTPQPSPASQTFNFSLGWNYIGLTVDPSANYKADDLINDLANTFCASGQNCILAKAKRTILGSNPADLFVYIVKWDGGKYSAHLVGSSDGNNFAIKVGEGYIIYSKNKGTATLNKWVAQQSSIQLSNGYSLISFVSIPDSINTAEKLLQNIKAQGTNPSNITTWVNGNYVIHILSSSNDNFSTSPGVAYFIKSNPSLSYRIPTPTLTITSTPTSPPANGPTPKPSPTSTSKPTPAPTPIPTSYKRVFVTSTLYSGNLGGVAGANKSCQDRANIAKLGGVWKAWISDTTSSPQISFSKTSGYKTLDGTIIASSWNNLTSGNLQKSIFRNEYGYFASSAVRGVWTSTNPAGAFDRNQQTCFNWTNNAPYYNGGIGQDGVTDSSWTQKSPDICIHNLHLYCFEQ